MGICGLQQQEVELGESRGSGFIEQQIGKEAKCIFGIRGMGTAESGNNWIDEGCQVRKA